jgi:hypothetical protein
VTYSVHLQTENVIEFSPRGNRRLRFIRASKQSRSYKPRTATLAVVVAVILALLGIVMAVYLIAIAA